MPRVSVVMPVFNEEGTLQRSIDSVLAQTFQDFELIIVDNASTDRSRDICLDASRLDPRIFVYSNAANIGAVRNFNRCFARASGDFVKLQSGNDYSKPNEISELLAALDSDQSAVLAYPTHIDPTPPYLDLVQDDPLERVSTLIRQFQSGHAIYGLCRREVIDLCSPMAQRFSPDQVWLAEIAIYGKIVCCDTRSFFRQSHERDKAGLVRMCSAHLQRVPEESPAFAEEALAYPPYLDCYAAYCEMIECARVSASLRRDLAELISNVFVGRWRPWLLQDVETATTNAQAYLAATTKRPSLSGERRYGLRLLDALWRLKETGLDQSSIDTAINELTRTMNSHLS